MDQLTLRAVLTGVVIGAVMTLSNVYVLLKTGWSLGVTVTSAVLGYALHRGLARAGLGRRPYGMLENTAMCSVASGAGYITGGGNLSALPALLMLTTARPNGLELALFFAVVAAVGVFTALPIKRQLIDVEQLPFPTGIATAETLRSLHAAELGGPDTGEGARKARRLGSAALVGAAIAWLRDGPARWKPFALPNLLPLPFSIGGHPAARWTLGPDGGLLMVGAGALVSFRTGWSLLLGAVLNYGVLAPALVARGLIDEVKYRPIVQWTLWGGAGVLFSSGLFSFACQWRAVGRSLKQIGALLSRRVAAEPDGEDECPPAWTGVGLAVLSPLVLLLLRHLFGVPLWAGAVTLALALVMGVVSARVTGETDTTPTKATGPVTQLLYGGMLPGNLPANIMGANVTASVGLRASDLLTNLKTAWLLGASPRQLLVGQLIGIGAGALWVVPAFKLIVPSADALGSELFPAPAAQVWAGVSKVLVVGAAALEPERRALALAGLVVGLLLAAAERWLPLRARPFVPSPSAIGIAMISPGNTSISMFIGASLAALQRRRGAAAADRVIFPVSSGFIAGESLMGILVAVLLGAGILGK